MPTSRLVREVMPGERDLAALVSGLTVGRRPGRFTLVTLDHPVALGDGVEALIAEAEGVTAVTTVETAIDRGWEHHFDGAWLTLEVHSSLEAVGLTAVVSAALAERGIACNVLAGYFHDHLLVPSARVEDAVAALEHLRADN